MTRPRRSRRKPLPGLLPDTPSRWLERVDLVLAGALLEHLRAILASRNGREVIAAMALGERDRLLGVPLLDALLRPVRGGRDKRRLFERAIVEVTDRAAAYARYAVSAYARDTGEPPATGIDASDVAALLEHARRSASVVLNPSSEASRNLLSPPRGMRRPLAPSSPHAPLYDEHIPLFRGFADGERLREDQEDDYQVADRVAARYASTMRRVPFAITDRTIAASDVLAALRAEGLDVEAVLLQPGSWPGQVDIVGVRSGRAVVWGAVDVDLEVEGERARLVGEIRIADEGERADGGPLDR